jgi:hypothetical protein
MQGVSIQAIRNQVVISVRRQAPEGGRRLAGESHYIRLVRRHRQLVCAVNNIFWIYCLGANEVEITNIGSVGSKDVMAVEVATQGRDQIFPRAAKVDEV